MHTRSSFRTGSCIVAVLAFILGAGTPAHSAPRHAALPRWDVAAVERARAGAARRLEGQDCQRVLEDFTDRQGHSLKENLGALELSPSDYLQTIRFEDGSTVAVCRQPLVLLAVATGGRVVYVCPGTGGISRFAQLQDPARADSLLIHEMLHTLGLGEDPPTTSVITRQVEARCRP